MNEDSDVVVMIVRKYIYSAWTRVCETNVTGYVHRNINLII